MLINVRQKLEHKLLVALFWWAGRLNNQQLQNFGGWLGRQLFRFGVRRKVVDKNLSIAFPKLTADQRTKLAQESYEQLGLVIVEWLKIRCFTKQQLQSLVTIHGKQHLEPLIKNPKGGILVGCHFNNWELQLASLAATFGAIQVYAGKVRNPKIDLEINNIRRQFGLVPIPKSPLSLRVMLQTLQNKQLLAIASDQNAPNRRCFVNFFGKKAALGSGFAMLARKKEVPLWFVWSRRKSILQHEVFIEPLNYPKTKQLDQDYQDTAQMYSDRLMQIIKQHPNHYFWFNRRWKTRPLNEDQNLY